MKKTKAEASRRAKRSRRKGHDFEREIASRLKVVFPNCRRHFEFRQSEARDGKDLIETGDYRFQLKKLRKYASISKIKEANADELLGEIPVLVTAGDGEPPVAVLPFDHFARLLKAEKDLAELLASGDCG